MKEFSTFSHSEKVWLKFHPTLDLLRRLLPLTRHTLSISHTLFHTHSLTHTLFHTLSISYTLLHTLSFTHTLFRTHSLYTLSFSHTLFRTHSLAHTLLHTLSFTHFTRNTVFQQEMVTVLDNKFEGTKFVVKSDKGQHIRPRILKELVMSSTRPLGDPLDQRFSTGVPWHARVPWDCVRGAASFHFYWPFSN